VSLLDIEHVMSKTFGKRVSTATISALFFAAAFGVYLGRYLRWNSWDIVNQPLGLLADVFERFINPVSHPRTWGVTILMGILLNIMYWSVRLMRPTSCRASASPA
jgi:uncharacterized membrane protein